MTTGKLRIFLTIGAFFSIVIGLIVIYNYFLLDNSIEHIRTSLRQVSKTSSLSEAEGVGLLLQDLFINEVSDSQINLQRLVASEAFENAFASPQYDRRGHDITFLLENLLSAHEKKRNPALLKLDKVIQFIYDRFYDLVQFGQFLISKLNGSEVKQKVSEEAALQMLNQARGLELKWKFEDAAAIYVRFLKNFPDYQYNRFVQLNLVAVYLRARHFDDAKRLISNIQITTAPPNILRLISMLETKLNEMEKLVDEREKMRSELSSKRSETPSAAPDSPVVAKLKGIERKKESQEVLRFKIGIISLHLFDLESAKLEFEELLRLTTDETMEKQSKWILAWIDLIRNDYSESKRLMAELLQKFPADRYADLSTFGLGAVAVRTGDYDEALKQFGKLADKPELSDIAYLLKYRTGDVYLYDLQDLSKALDQFKQSEKLSQTSFASQTLGGVFPDLSANMRELAFKKLLQGDIKAARRFFEEILSLNPSDAWSHCGYGTTLYLDGEKKKGIEEATVCRTTKKDPYINAAVAFLNDLEGKSGDASLLYEEAVQERKDYAVALYNLGYLEIRSKKYEQAAAHLIQAKKEAGRFSRYLPPFNNNLGVTYLKLGRTKDAESEFLTGIRSDADFLDTRFNLAKFYTDEGKPDLAAKYFPSDGVSKNASQ